MTSDEAIEIFRKDLTRPGEGLLTEGDPEKIVEAWRTLIISGRVYDLKWSELRNLVTKLICELEECGFWDCQNKEDEKNDNQAGRN